MEFTGPKFQLKGIASPGKVNIQGHGTVLLEKLPPAKQEQLYFEGCQFLEPTPEYRKILYPDEPEINTDVISFEKKKA